MKSDLAVERLRVLPVAVVADVLDRLGLRAQVLDERVRPLHPPEAVAGRAYPIQMVESVMVDEESAYAHEIAAVDATPAGAVVVVATGFYGGAACFGDLLMTRAAACGAAGVVTDGAVRDLLALRAARFPTYAVGVSARDSLGRLIVASFGAPVVCGHVSIHPGDLVLGDADGVVVIPHQAAEQALAAAEAKLVKEGVARGLIAGGASVADVYASERVL